MKKIITSTLILFLFFGCKKENQEKLSIENSNVTVQDAKAFLNNLSDLKNRC
jgi:hypothetical protein